MVQAADGVVLLVLRLELLSEVQRLAESIGVMEEVSATCETAASFRLYQVPTPLRQSSPASTGRWVPLELLSGEVGC